eukprot:CAMPEP_0168555508 /NCGR_PEP_ID=MMETSP0413-20121227/8375_1 /TAXON_ID=136452 /ORGANISM="Filamoeba nolandi, Strain NC-AS-23-1" /LENGTH=234 /DNA_ID=CAMNT_0008586369 /DNA_START=27 /DNA_END=731 /DNA_ORIENTATION=-
MQSPLNNNQPPMDIPLNTVAPQYQHFENNNQQGYSFFGEGLDADNLTTLNEIRLETIHPKIHEYIVPGPRDLVTYKKYKHKSVNTNNTISADSSLQAGYFYADIVCMKDNIMVMMRIHEFGMVSPVIMERAPKRITTTRINETLHVNLISYSQINTVELERFNCDETVSNYACNCFGFQCCGDKSSAQVDYYSLKFFMSNGKTISTRIPSNAISEVTRHLVTRMSSCHEIQIRQ